MHDIAGLVALATMGLWIAYLVPHRLRYRQQLLESRTEDRFSGGLRVLAVADARRRDVRAMDARAECGPDSPKRSGLLSPARGVPVTGRPAVTRGRGGVVERPYVTQDKITADDARRAAQVRAKRAATLARRAAAARRRAALTTALLVASLVAWLVVGVSSVPATVALVPTVLLAGVLALGRRAVVQSRAADEAWERQQRSAVRRQTVGGRAPRVTGRAHHPSDSHTEAIAQVAPDARTSGSAAGRGTAGQPAERGADDASAATSDDAAVRRPSSGPATAPVAAPAPSTAPDGEPVTTTAAGEEPVPATTVGPTVTVTEVLPQAAVDGQPSPTAGDGWSPVPVPRPTYTTKASAPRREPLPLVVDDVAPAVPVAAAAPGAPAQGGDPVVPPLDLDSILARRRAAGE